MLLLSAGLALAQPAEAQRAGLPGDNRIENQVAVFAALDKVTARISKLEVALGESVKFGALTVTAKSCYTRSPLEAPKTSTFVEISEQQLDGQRKKIFGGWMFAESPGLNAVEHPVYDVWLTDCSKPRNVAAAAPAARGAAAPKGQPQPGTRPTAGQPTQAPQPGQAAKGGQAQPEPPPPAPGGWGAATDQPADDFKRRRPPR